MSLWDGKRVQRYLNMYGDPRKKKGTQAILCRDASKLISGDSVLDVGCGMGHLIPFVEGYKYAGLDLSEAMLGALRERFGEVDVHPADATKPFSAVADTVISISLIIHLPTLDDVRSLLRYMWIAADKAIVFGVETETDRVHIRPDGLTLRSISLDNVLKILKELGVDESQVTWVHQKYTYMQQIVVTPSKEKPVSLNTRLVNRTTLFKVVK